MSRKYTPPKKKKKGVPQIAKAPQAAQAAATPAAAATAVPVTEYSMTRPPAPRPGVKAGSVPDSAAEAVKYASLPHELKRILVYTGAAIILLIILWLILR